MIRIISLGLLFLFLANSCSSKKDDAVKYYDRIVKLENNVIIAIDTLDASLKTLYPKKMFEAQQHALKLAQSYNDTLNNFSEFEKDTVLLHATRIFFSEIASIINVEYAQLIAINALPENMYTQIMQDRSIFLNNEIDRKISESIVKLTDEMSVFAKKYEFEMKVE